MDGVPENVDVHSAIAILQVARRIGLSCELDELLDQIINETLRVVDCDRASIFLYDADRNELVTRVAHGLKEIYLPMDRGVVGACARDRRTINVRDAYADDRFNPDVDRQTGYRTRTILSCPMIDYDDRLVGVVQAVNKNRGEFTQADEWLLETLSSQAAVAFQRATLLHEYAEKQRLSHELNLAREIQQGLLPKSNPAVANYEVVGWNQPADETGGDGYGFMALPGGALGVLLADASGHGIAPALVVAQLQSMLRVMLERTDLTQGRILGAVNDLLCNDLPADRFVTAFLGVLDPQRHTLEYISAGQGPILHVKPGPGKVLAFNATTCPLGILPADDFEPAEPIAFDLGDVLILCTDGFYEWMNRDGEQFGIARLSELALCCADQSAEEILRCIRASVSAFGPDTAQADDLTAVVVKRVG